MKINYSREVKDAAESGITVAKKRLAEIKQFARTAGLRADRFEDQDKQLSAIAADLKSAFRPRDDYGRKYDPTSAEIFFSDAQRTYLKAAVQLSADEDERLLAQNEGRMPGVLLDQLRQRIDQKRSMLVGEAFDNLDWESVLVEWVSRVVLPAEPEYVEMPRVHISDY